MSNEETDILILKDEILQLTNEKPTWCNLLFYFTYYALNMFRTLTYPSSGARDCVDELPHRSSCSQFVVCWSFCCGWYLVVFVLQAENTTLCRNVGHRHPLTQLRQTAPLWSSKNMRLITFILFISHIANWTTHFNITKTAIFYTFYILLMCPHVSAKSWSPRCLNQSC